MSFCQNPGAPAPLGKRWRLSGRSTQVRQHRRRDPGEVADEVPLRERGLVDAVARREQGLVEVGELELLARDGPQALGLHRPRAPRARRRTPARPGRASVLRMRHREHLRIGGGKRGVGLAIGLRRVHRPLADDLARVAPALEALERRLAHVPVARPAAELRTDHELRADPPHAREVAAPATAVVGRRRRVERRRVGLEPLEDRLQLLARAPVEPGADLARESQSLVLVDADDDRAQVLRGPLPRRPAADDQLLFRSRLDLEPRRGPAARLVARAAVLGHDALEALGLDRLEERHALGVDVGARTGPVRWAGSRARAGACATRGARRRASGRRGRAGRRPGRPAARAGPSAPR